MCFVGHFLYLINGSQGHIVSSRGLRQGDHLSPYLFLLCIEGLVSLSKASHKSLIPGIKECRGAPSINHLLFVDDSVIFCKTNVDTTKKVQSLLIEYEVASGKCVNLNKTAMVFSRNTPTHIRIEVMALWSNGVFQQLEKDVLV